MSAFIGLGLDWLEYDFALIKLVDFPTVVYYVITSWFCWRSVKLN